jgi:hypothetical protein
MKAALAMHGSARGSATTRRDSSDLRSTRDHPFQDSRSGVRTRALRSDMSPFQLAAPRPNESESPPAPSASAILAVDDPFPERTRKSSRRALTAWARDDRSSNRELVPAAELVLDRVRRARNALPEIVRPDIEPLPPSTRVRSLFASRTPVGATPPRARSTPALRRIPRQAALSGASSAHSRSPWVSVRRSPTGARSTSEVSLRPRSAKGADRRPPRTDDDDRDGFG